MNPDMPYQLRSEETGISYAPTIREALEFAEQDLTIWKISFNSEIGDRIRLVKRRIFSDTYEWVLEPLPLK